MWRPRSIEDIATLERVQCRAMRYILQDKVTDYKPGLRLISYCHWCTGWTYWIYYFWWNAYRTRMMQSISSSLFHSSIVLYTRPGNAKWLKHNYSCTSVSRHCYFSLMDLLWNSLPVIDLNQSFNSIKYTLLAHLQNHFHKSLDASNFCKLSLSLFRIFWLSKGVKVWSFADVFLFILRLNLPWHLP